MNAVPIGFARPTRSPARLILHVPGFRLAFTGHLLSMAQVITRTKPGMAGETAIRALEPAGTSPFRYPMAVGRSGKPYTITRLHSSAPGPTRVKLFRPQFRPSTCPPEHAAVVDLH